MSHLVRWWDGRSGGEKLALGIAGALAVVATGGALAYAIATEGLVVASGGTLVVVGNDVARAGLKAPNARGRSSRDGANPRERPGSHRPTTWIRRRSHLRDVAS